MAPSTVSFALCVILIYVTNSVNCLECPYGWIKGATGDCYEFNVARLKTTWKEARSFCQAHQGDLLSISSKSEMDFIKVQLTVWQTQDGGSSKSWWTGLRYSSARRDWMWTDGAPYNLSLITWKPGEPDNFDGNQGCIVVDNDGWSDMDCTVDSAFICKRPINAVVKCDERAGWMNINGACYRFSDVTRSWSNARAECHKDGAELAFPTVGALSYTEQHILFSMVHHQKHTAWIGVYGKPKNGRDNTYLTCDGKELTTSTYWKDGEPTSAAGNATCVGIIYTAEQFVKSWFVIPCNAERRFICRKPEGVCQEGWRSYQNKCYLFNLKKQSPWEMTKQYCENMGASMLSIRSEEEQAFLISNLNDMRQAGVNALWIGVSDAKLDGTFKWTDDSALYYNNWYPGAPNNTVIYTDCGLVNVGDTLGGWSTTNNCQLSYGAACDKAATTPLIQHITTPTIYTCPDNYVLRGAMCYAFKQDEKTWFGAKKDCGTDGAQLVSIKSRDKLDLIADLITNNAWIGLHDRTQEGNFMWNDESAAVTFFNWKHGEPNNKQTGENCVEMIGTGDLTGQWNDKMCDTYDPYICEMPAHVSGVAPTGSYTMRPSWSAACGAYWDEDKSSGNCYQFNNDLLSWHDSQAVCRHHGGELLSITSLQEQFYISGRLANTVATHLWIGGTDFIDEGGWQWTDGAPMAFFNWNTGEPNDAYHLGEDCAKISVLNGLWIDERCNRRYGFICKKKGKPATTPTATPATTVKPVTTCAEGSAYECKKYTRGTPRYCSRDCDVQASSYFRPGTCYGPGHQFEGCCYACYKDCTPCSGEQMGCQAGWIGFGDNCFKVEVAKKDWEEARTQCLSMGGDLSSIADVNEHNFIISRFPEAITDGVDKKTVWIGLYDLKQRGSFKWSDTSPVSFTRWARHEPNDYHQSTVCVSMNKNGGWKDQSCRTTGDAYVCKAKKGVVPTTSVPPTDPGCPAGSFGYRWSCFRLSDSKKSWSDAEADCIGQGGHLVTVRDRYVQALVASQIAGMEEKTWLGLRHVSGSYAWSSGHSIDYTHWGSRHTGNEVDKCVAMDSGRSVGLWSDHECTRLHRYVCEGPRVNHTSPTPLTTTPSPFKCRQDWTEAGDKCYNGFTYYAHKLTWFEARDACRNLGGDLASFHNKSIEALVIQKEIGYSYWDRVWIGLSKLGSSDTSYTWSDGSPYDHTNWDDGQPDNHNGQELCVEFEEKSKKWRDKNCYVAQNFACQIDKGKMPLTTPKPDTTPDPSCKDENKFCANWARSGECTANPNYMLHKCKKSCGKCGGVPLCGNENNWFRHNTSCYYIAPNYGNEVKLSWSDARSWCLRNGGELASIHDEEANNFLTSVMGKKTTQIKQWIGLNELSMEGYKWSDGSPVDYRNWAMNEPNDNHGGEKCTALHAYDGGWVDENCGNDKLGYICRRSYGTPPTKTVPVTQPMPGYCPQGFTGIGNKCYKIFGTDPDRRLNWTNALNNCKSMGKSYNLASINNIKEQALVTTLLHGYDFDAYIGFQDFDTHNWFRWSDNSDVDVTYWGNGEPNGAYSSGTDCVVVQTTKYSLGLWNDVKCAEERPYICQTLKDASIVTPPPIQPGCRDGYTPYEGSCYYMDSNVNTWSVARKFCQDSGGDLVSVNNGFEQAFIQLMAIQGGFKDVWIGLNSRDDGHTFKWSDTWPVSYTRWSKDKPTMNASLSCVSMASPDGYWNDTSCALKLPAICEINSGTPPPYTEPPPGRCLKDWKPFGAFCYSFQTTYRAWASAEVACKYNSQGRGSIVSIHSTAEEEYVMSLSNRQKYPTAVWIGLIRQPGSSKAGFAWSDKTPVDFMNLNAKAPTASSASNKNCIRLQTDGTWYEEQCTWTAKSICKMRKIQDVTTPAPNPCPDVWSLVAGKCYKSYNSYYSEKSWPDARDFCRGLGAELASFHDSTTERQVINMEMRFSYHGRIWIGLSNPNATTAPSWSDGTPYNYRNWEKNQPDNHNGYEQCVEYNVQSQQWKDRNCAVTQGWICQIDGGKQLLSTVTTPKSLTSVSPCGDPKWLLYQGHCYYFSPTYGFDAEQSWYGARNWCVTQGAHLTSIHSIEENNFLTTQLGLATTKVKYWIGLNLLNNQGYEWSDGTPTDMINWAIDEPNNVFGGQKCVDLYTNDGAWNDDNCGEVQGYICKRPAGGYSTQTVPKTTPSTGYCPQGHTPVGNKCYRVVDGDGRRLNWTDALAACRSQPGHEFASITSLEEQALVTTLLYGKKDGVWIGLDDREIPNKFLWIDNEAVDVTYWGRGEPDGKKYGATDGKDCVMMKVGMEKAGEWTDEDCSVERGYVCQTYKDPSITVPPQEPTPVCREGYTALGQGCYRLDSTPQTWKAARTSCQDHGGELMSITDGFEQALAVLMSIRGGLNKPVWTGLSRTKNGHDYRWSDGWPLTYTKWANQSPKPTSEEDCAILTMDAGLWHKVLCNQRNPSICEITTATPPPYPTDGPGRCPDGWQSFGGNCYYMEANKYESWADANMKCRYLSHGAKLVSINSKEEDTFIHGMINSVSTYRTSVWMGLLRVPKSADSFYWVDGTPYKFTAWNDGKPTDKSDGYDANNCVQLLMTGKWEDIRCSNGQGFICKVPKIVPPGSSTTGVTSQATTTVPISTTERVPGTADKQSSSGVITGSVLGVVGILALVALVVVVFLKTRTKKGDIMLDMDNAAYSRSNDGIRLSQATDVHTSMTTLNSGLPGDRSSNSFDNPVYAAHHRGDDGCGL